MNPRQPHITSASIENRFGRRIPIKTLLPAIAFALLTGFPADLGAEVKPSRLRDRLWIWAHPAGVYNANLKRSIGEISTVTPVPAAEFMGIRNLIFVRYRGKPEPPFGDMFRPMRRLDRVYWSLVGAHGATSKQERAQVFALAEAEPKIAGFILDDFFHVQPRGNASDSLREKRAWLAANNTTFPVTLTFTAPSPEPLDQIILVQSDWHSGDYRSGEVSIELSKDGTAWEEVARGTVPNDPAARLDLSWREQTVAAVRVRILNSHDRSGARSCGFREITLAHRGKDRGFGRWKASASSSYHGFNPSHAVRGVVPPDSEPFPASLTPAELQAIGSHEIRGRKLPVMAVIYTRQVKPRATPHIAAVDELCLWTWRPDDLDHLEANFEALERLAPDKELYLGCYMYDFHEGKPLSVERMKHQVELGHRWLREGRIAGMIFLATPVVDVDLEAVTWTRQWIADHGDELLN